MLRGPPYSPFLNPIEEFFSLLKRKTIKSKPDIIEDLVAIAHEASKKISKETSEKFIQHTHKYLFYSLKGEKIF